jgi:hypothetical protein
MVLYIFHNQEYLSLSHVGLCVCAMYGFAMDVQ